MGRLSVAFKGGMSFEAALLEVARHCLIHRTIERHPEIRVSLDKG